MPGLGLNPWLIRYGGVCCVSYLSSSLLLQGLETGSRKVASHVVRQRDTIFVFKSAYEPGSEECRTMGEHLVAHGDGVKDVSFTVEDLDGIMEKCKAKGVCVTSYKHL